MHPRILCLTCLVLKIKESRRYKVIINNVKFNINITIYLFMQRIFDDSKVLVKVYLYIEYSEFEYIRYNALIFLYYYIGQLHAVSNTAD